MDIVEVKKPETEFIVEEHQLRAPTLLIGIGGIGGQIVKGVYDAMSDYDRTFVEMVVMDTNVSDLDKFIDTGIQFIQTSENQTVQAYLTANKEYVEWFPTNPLINAKNLTQGAGQIRSVSRLGALASKGEGRFDVIDKAIDKVLTNHGDPLQRSVRVMIVGSSTGGTGSGLGIQLPFYVRNALERANIPNALIRGMFLMPSLTQDVQDTEAKEAAVNVNGYAFLKELNAFYRAQKVMADDNVLRIEEYVPGIKETADGDKKLAMAGAIPYDFLFLVEKYGNSGVLGTLEDYIARSSQIVMNQLFSPISEKGFSTEDNLITSSVPTGGMNRYCGAGIANAIYPKEEVVRYCTVRYAEQLIQDYWMAIDEEYKIREEKQRRLRKADPTLEPLEKSSAYCQIFDDMSDPKKRNVSSEVAALKEELTYRVTKEVPNENGGKDSVKEERKLVDMLMDGIHMFLSDTFQKLKLDDEAKACRMDPKRMEKPTGVVSYVDNKMTALRDFKAAADKKVSDTVVSAAEDVVPSDLKLAQAMSKDAVHNIYAMLQNKHPIIARYVLYALRNQLKQEKKAVDEDLSVDNSESSIFKKDYYPEGKPGERKESPREALSLTKPGWLAKTFHINSAAYNRLITQIAKDADDEIRAILERAENSLKSLVYRLAVERLDVLIELYEKFFEELSKMVEDKKKEAKALEKGKGTGPNDDFSGDLYICSNSKCKKQLYSEFVDKIGDKGMEMSDEVKKGFFDQMFGEYESMLAEKANPTAYVTHLSMRDLFEQGVLAPITAQFRENGYKHLDMDILEAIKKQYDIEHRTTEDTRDPAKYAQYFKKLVDELKELAMPYLSFQREVENYKSGGKLSYSWGLNYSAVAAYQSGDKAKSVDMKQLRDMFVNEEGPILPDNSLSPLQLVCYAAIYDLRIENCKMYKVGSTAEKKYAERLKNLADQEFVISDENDGYLDVIHPHLDRRWHEHAFLPELMGYDEDVMAENIRRAFMLAKTMKWVTHEEDKDECLTCWWFKRSAKHRTPVYVDGKELKSASIAGLYKAFDSNRVMVEMVLERAEKRRQDAFDNRPMEGTSLALVLEQDIIKGLIGDPAEANSNILDLLYVLLSDSGNRKLVERMLETLEKYVDEYCMFMESNNKNKANALAEQVKLAIGKGAAKLQSGEASGTFRDNCGAFLGTSEF